MSRAQDDRSAGVSIDVVQRCGRATVSTATQWEPIVGYSRAVRSGNIVAVTGTVGINADGTFPKTAGEQTRRALTIIQAAIEALGGRLDDVIRTRIFVRDQRQWEPIARVHGRYLGHVRPANTLVEVSNLVGEYEVEIEAEAVVER